MASVVRDPGGLKRIQVMLRGEKKTVRLGAVSVRQAEAVKVRIEQLASSLVTGIMDAEAEVWVAGLDDTLYGRLAAVGLVPSRDKVRPTLGGLLDAYFETLAVKPGTAATYEQTRRSLEKYFGVRRLLSAISALDGDRWRKALEEEGLAQATISKRIKTARQIFKRGLKWKMLAENPLDDVKAGPQTNRARMYFVTREDAAKVLDACPDLEWRCIFALSRFGGMRCPSEHMALRWDDIDWHRGRVLVRSCKTEGNEGGDCRYIPLFPELRVHLRDAFEQAEPGSEYVISRHRDLNCNLRTQLNRILRRAGLKAWPRLFHNLRSSRQTELAAKHPIHVVCAWLGNSRVVAQDHYLQVLDSDFEAALADTEVGEATQKATQHAAAPGRTGGKGGKRGSAQTPALWADAA